MTTATRLPTPATPEDLLRVPDDGHLYELVNDQLVEKPVSLVACLIASRVLVKLTEWCDQSGLEIAVMEATCQCFPHQPTMVRRPDVLYVSEHRCPRKSIRHGHLSVAPEIVVEVIFPNESAYELDDKISDYFRAGVRQVWVINPDHRTLRIHRPDGRITELHDDAEICGDADLLPGFQCPLRSIFPPLE